MYQKVIRFDYLKGELDVVSLVKNNGSVAIPLEPDNNDYKEFLKYLEDNELTMNDIPELED